MCVIVASQDSRHGTKDLQIIFHYKYWFSLVRTSSSTQILAMLQWAWDGRMALRSYPKEDRDCMWYDNPLS